MTQDGAAMVAKTGVSRDTAVQRTNDDSVVSKRSAVFHNYFKDMYLRYFVRKLSRRSPLINRGYYLRMLVITDLVERSIRHLQTAAAASTGPVQVVSLGAGYDTLAMRLKGEPQYAGVHFYEIDFPSVMQSKSELVRVAPKDAFPEDLMAEPAQELVKLRGKNYYAVGVDLRDTEHDFITTLMKVSPDFSPLHPTVLFAECVMQYMPPYSASDLIKRVACAFSRAIFVAYDQINPSDSFGNVMQASLRSKGSPLLGLAETPGKMAMLSRAFACGMKETAFANFHDLSHYYLTGDERRRVEALEPFDETEEWCEMCEHYGITMAATSHEVGMPAHPAFMGTTREAATQASQATAQVAAHVEKWPVSRFGFEGWGNGQAFAEELPSGDVVIVSFGGFSATRGHQRTNTVRVHSLCEGDYRVTTTSSSAEPPALVFHSFSRVARGVYVVLGGRTNPTDVMMDAFLLQLDFPEQAAQVQKKHIVAWWSKLEPVAGAGELPEARYRHTAIAVEDNTENLQRSIFVFGGRNGAGYCLNDAWIARVCGTTVHWKRLPLAGEIPPPCCSSAVIDIRATTAVLLSGGLLAGDVCEGAVWRVDWATGNCCKMSYVLPPRFSHTMCHVKVDGVARVLVLGGSTCQPREGDLSALLLDAETGETASVLALPPECPTWTRHCCISLGDGVVAVLGGGFTCFSFGTFTVKPLLLFLGDTSDWNVDKRPKTVVASCQLPLSPHLPFKRPQVEVQPFSKEAFLALACQPNKPVVFRKVDLGSCVDVWADPAYLKAREGNMMVSVHVARETHLLDFVRKNFAFQHVSFASLVDHCVAATSNSPKAEGEAWYFRAVAPNMKTERANLWKDFPGLGSDFVLPPAVAEHVEPRMHQACLRLNAPPLQLWTHYDTLDNVLCQVVGKKRVVLFPPSEYNNLYMSGSSSVVLNIDAPDLDRFPRFADACRHATEVVLEPGDMLFIPSHWFHHLTTMEGSYSISVNVFFERFPREDYDKKDLYGNKDFPAVSRLRKRVVEHVQQLISESARERTSDGQPLPLEFVEFALRQAIQDLEEITDNMAASQSGGERH
ncbi:tRNA wybutosine-synthesizing protein 4 [Trypanosoma rangeli]|uniref:tRNA wybutosine-synthesizing protein 4 n=1 Tax=Trypanosoma rangeli TaxID=5698 RepID=A0A3R7N301_TRYRA|nr:tRNA wybutosine-synthesizing protein 4 [Trypanosoma rangeli]RNF12025.1 tRNA wybutosine-synthesizing protein 4 [Trypanosoma rangeli]|eukprot:RNF12025.1 tRNA wybutosine-synthesizing protein 4 [Trypanosoma rangeli]